VQGEKRHLQPIARLFVIKKKLCRFFQPPCGYFPARFERRGISFVPFEILISILARAWGID
jgi:hypothetical protein